MDTPLADRLLTYIRDTDTVTFAELMNRFAEFKDGNMEYAMANNVILWQGLTNEATEALESLRASGTIVAVPTTVLTYLIDGRSLSLPIARTTREYKKPHWLPVVWRPLERCPPKIQKMVAKARAAKGATP